MVVFWKYFQVMSSGKCFFCSATALLSEIENEITELFVAIMFQPIDFLQGHQWEYFWDLNACRNFKIGCSPALLNSFSGNNRSQKNSFKLFLSGKIKREVWMESVDSILWIIKHAHPIFHRVILFNLVMKIEQYSVGCTEALYFICSTLKAGSSKLYTLIQI